METGSGILETDNLLFTNFIFKNSSRLDQQNKEINMSAPNIITENINGEIEIILAAENLADPGETVPNLEEILSHPGNWLYFLVFLPSTNAQICMIWGTKTKFSGIFQAYFSYLKNVAIHPIKSSS